MKARLLQSIALCASAGMVGCGSCDEHNGEIVRYVVPSRVRGVIAVVSDTTAPEPDRDSHGVTVYRVPEGRVVRVPSLGPVDRWHGVIAVDAHGRALKDDGETVTVHELTAYAWGYCAFVGTRDAGAKALKEVESMATVCRELVSKADEGNQRKPAPGHE